MTGPTSSLGALLSREGRRDPNPFYGQLHRQGPVCALTDPASRFDVVVHGYDPATDRCVLTVDGKQIDMRADGNAERLMQAAKSWPEQNVSVIGTTRTPYKCVGGVVFNLQRAGKRVGFVAEPPAG